MGNRVSETRLQRGNLPALLTALLIGTLARPGLSAAEPRPVGIEFNRDIRPILSDTCFQCHGPDQAKRKAKLRLDSETEVFAERGGYRIIEPGNPAKSELFRRIAAEDEKERMPPVRSGRKLTSQQIEVLRRWIEQGAKWQKHWSFLTPQRPDPPRVQNRARVRNGIDAFILARLEREGLTPAPEADRATLIRRVTLDLTGLPPTPDEVDVFLADRGPNAYEKVVDRLLQSPRYGERMATRWLDAARYADTNGYQSDGERTMWRWRDWVIEAFNHNMPFDQFTIEQIAGDRLPHATLEQKIATGFNRNHRGNGEGGIIPEEYAVEYVVDRVDTTATVWLGLTLGCARCHDHKYDPIKQKEFYQVFAYFNNVPEQGRAFKYGNSPPLVKAPTPQQQVQLRELERQLAAAESRLTRLEPELTAAQSKWEKSFGATLPLDWSVTAGLVAHYALDGDTTDKSGHAKAGKFQDGGPAYAPGRTSKAGHFDGQRVLNAGDVGRFGFYDKFSIGAWIYPTSSRDGTVVSRMIDAPQAEGYSLLLDRGKLHLNLVKRWLDDALRVETERSLPPNRWYHVLATYDGSRVASGVKLYIDGRSEKLKINLDELNQSFQTKEPLRIGAGGGPESRFHGSIADVRIYNECLRAQEAALIATPDTITDLVAMPAEKRTKPQADKLHAYFLEKHAPEPIRQAHQQLVRLRKQRAQLIESFPTTMVMEERPTPRDTFVLSRGQYDKPGEKVTAGIPASLPPLPPGVPNNRLGFARWLVDPTNPLTARVAVNRYWQMYFGSGLVKTVEDFGSQGEGPVHPELLDWLATEFIRTGWDIKAMQRLIVTSSTYRQASKATPALLQNDPENRRLARGPRFRLSAEMVRDQALAISGLLVEKVGGPSVKPYQPAGLWKELTGAEDYVQDHGASLYRRSMYTFWKRTVAPPSMMTFDAAGREMCTVRETRTNTPLQALTLMNDVTYVEASRVLAQRIMTEGGTAPEERLTLAFRLATARKPNAAELKILLDGFHHYRHHYCTNWKAAIELLSAGESRRNEKLEIGELAAYTAVSGLILNLDEVITKE
jgi:hypothetical protein